MFLPGESQGRGAWWAAVCGVAQSQTQLKQLGSSSACHVQETERTKFFKLCSKNGYILFKKLYLCKIYLRKEGIPWQSSG